MRFKEHLLKKIRMDELAGAVSRSLAPADGAAKADRDAMAKLLKLGGFSPMEIRDLTLYPLADGEPGRFLVLDNDLAIYKTTAEDVALRKSPTVKEMVSIKNAIRILSDSDVVESKKEASLKTVHDLCLSTLDLSHGAAEIRTLAEEGKKALAVEHDEGVTESLTLFAELLGYTPPPKALAVPDHLVLGQAFRNEAGEPCYGPVLLYNRRIASLKLLREPVVLKDKEQIEHVFGAAYGRTRPDLEGGEVFDLLEKAVIEKEGL